MAPRNATVTPEEPALQARVPAVPGNMFEKLAQIEKSYEELTDQISSPEFMSDMTAYARLMKQHRSLGEVVNKYREVRKMQEDLQGAKELAAMADDDEMSQMAALEI